MEIQIVNLNEIFLIFSAMTWTFIFFCYATLGSSRVWAPGWAKQHNLKCIIFKIENKLPSSGFIVWGKLRGRPHLLFRSLCQWWPRSSQVKDTEASTLHLAILQCNCTALTFKVHAEWLWFSWSFVTILFLLDESYRAVLAAASPSLLGPSLLQEGSEAEDMVSVTVPMMVIVMTVITMSMIMITCSIEFELLQKSRQ